MHAAAFVLLAMVAKAGAPGLFMPPREVKSRWDRRAYMQDVITTAFGEMALWCEELHGPDGACYEEFYGKQGWPRPILQDVLSRWSTHLVLVDGRPVDQYDFAARAVQNGQTMFFAAAHGVPAHTQLSVGRLALTEAAKVPFVSQCTLSGDASMGNRCGAANVATVRTDDGVVAVWSDCSANLQGFRAQHFNRQGIYTGRAFSLPPCCPTKDTEFAVLKMARLSFVLIYAGRVGHGFDGISELVMYADDYSTWREFAITPVADSPRHIAAAALNAWSWDHVIVWDDKEGVHAVRGEIAKAMKCVTVAPKGSLPTVASDGRQFMVAWLDGTNVLAADPEHPDEVQVIATDAATFMPFLRLIWSPSTDFVVYWRRGTDPAKLELMRQQLVLADEAVKPAAH